MNELLSLLREGEAYREPWVFPAKLDELVIYISTNRVKLQDLIKQIQTKQEKLLFDYSVFANEIEIIKDRDSEKGDNLEQEFDSYWEVKEGDKIITSSDQIKRKLELRIVELACQEEAAKADVYRGSEGVINSLDSTQNVSVSQAILSQVAKHETTSGTNAMPNNLQEPSITPGGPTTRRQISMQYPAVHYLYGHELRIPEFSGAPEEFESFWELFEELVDKQPYSDLEKLSILLSSCKGDAERALRMIPRNGRSYGLAVKQLKSQFQDVRRNKTILLRKLQSLPRAGDDPRQLQNTYNDILAIVAEMRKQDEAVDNTCLLQTVLGKFSRSIQDEAAKREYDSRKTWSMTDLLENLDVLVKRRVHVGFKMGRTYESDTSTILAVQTNKQKLSCAGCNGPHRFVNCNRYIHCDEKRKRLKQLNACWICFSRKHRSNECHKQRCPICGGPHHSILCKRQDSNLYKHSYKSSKIPNRRPLSPLPPRKHRPYQNSKQQYAENTYTRTTSRSQSFTPGERRSPSPILRSRPDQRQRLNTRRSESSQSTRSSRSSKTRKSPNRVTFVNFAISADQDCNLVSDAVHTNDTHYQLPNSQSIGNPQCTRLMTVPVRMYNNFSGCLETVIALLDSASDSSFIANEVIRRFHLHTHSERSITVATFGGRADRRRTRQVDISLFNSNNESIEVSLLSQEYITDTLHYCSLTSEDIQFIKENVSTTSSDLYLERTLVKPEILIGIDYFNTIFSVDQPSLQLPSGFYLTSTFFWLHSVRNPFKSML
ncbi:peptidase family A16 [Oesophagostomum dentatum]|uniref:Peptidase family A16 n=1 Tax=Oesophagostomum dentatum TaxID=61180 RepID=A0A0B1SYM6_OESDE|nr:peptidase family A16 [Oesophagostomum dentatum]